MAYDDRETGLTVEDRGSKLGLPQNQDAEANVLAAMLLSPEVVEEAQVELQPDDFYRPIHKTIYTAMVDMYNSRIPIDSISLIDYLRSINKLDAVGGEAYILELMGQTLSLVNWQHHAAIVRRDSMLRELIGATNEINALAYNAPTDTKEVVELAESKLLKVTAREVKSSYKTLTEFMVEAYNEAEEVCQAGGQAAGVPTGFPSLDRMLMGFREGQLIIIGARPAVGKTSFALNLALNAAAAGYTVGFFSLEMSRDQLVTRLLASEGLIENTRLISGDLRESDWVKIAEGASSLSRLDIRIDDNPLLTVADMNAKCRRLDNLGLVVIDYLQLMTSAGGKGYSGENRQQAVSDISRMLKIMAKELQVPVLCLSQLSRANEKRDNKRPMLSDLRESGAIEQDADIVMFLYRDDYYNEDTEKRNIAECIVAKNRHGETGKVELRWMPEYTAFGTLENRYGDDGE